MFSTEFDNSKSYAKMPHFLQILHFYMEMRITDEFSE